MTRVKTIGRLLAASMALALIPACGATAGSREKERLARIEGFPGASVTIFPPAVFWTGKWETNEEYRAFGDAYQRGFREDKARPFARLLGLLLEEQGYDRYAVSDASFEFSRDEAAREQRGAAFGKFVGGLGLSTDYALCIEFIHTGKMSGMCEQIYSVIVDSKGRVVCEDTVEERAGTELEGLELACARVAQAMGVEGLPKKEMAEDKKRMLREARAKEPPSGSERKAMKERREALKTAGASARVLVYPARVDGARADGTCATRLSALLNEAALCRATAAGEGPVMEGGGWPNEMQVLWLFARNVREYVRRHPADSDYVLFADYWFNPRGQVWAVHFVVCDRAGGWAIVDLQNSHQEAFQRIKPQSLEDCDRLVLEQFKAMTR